MTAVAQEERGGYLLHNLLLFGRLLRQLGLDASPDKMIHLASALAHVDLGQQHDFYHTLRCLLVHDHEQFALFDGAFRLFWRAHPAGSRALPALPTGNDRQPETEITVSAESRRQIDPDVPRLTEPPAVAARLTYSDRHRLRQRDFSQLSSEELAAVRQLIAAIDWQPAQRRTRRRRPGEGSDLDLRRSLRHNLRYGGEWLELARRLPKQRPRPLVVLADISGSMEGYTRLLLHFVYVLARGLGRPVEAFTFSTRLTRITRQLRTRHLERAMAEVSQTVGDWSGGTRIGQALKDFNYIWGRRVLSRGAVVLIISDGWDRGEPDLVGREMARLQRTCYRLIWLNPLLGLPQYRPLTRGLLAALPFVDDFLPVHNLASLEELGKHLASIDARRRPFGRQHSGKLADSRTWKTPQDL